ncbi:D(2) dopamine receptor A-like [Patiria miniata]|uniref:G-protein coupled receptors family 1 profile domain-containing protein n=1 Tax=Patiria miniata TaxID=46514 RepID=A0A913ZR54_PATMI|nr:D(2) dopamine receptor A-like [Patiria miniata]
MSLLPVTANSSTITIGTSLSPSTVPSGIDFKNVLLIVSAVILVLSVISGVIGNCLVCLSVYRNRNLRNANNALLVNLAVGDLVVCFTSIPIMLAEVINNYGDCNPYGDIICHLQTFCHVSSSSVQLVTLVAISVERYEAIVHPFETKKKRRRVIVGTSISWIMAIVIAVPASIFLNESSLFLLCTCRLTEPPFDYVHTVIIAPLGIGCLVCVMVFYLRIFRTVRKHVKKKRKSTVNDTSTSTRTKKEWCNSLRSRCCCCCRANAVGAMPEAHGQFAAAIGPRSVAQDVTNKPSVSGAQSIQTNKENEDSNRGNPATIRSPLSGSRGLRTTSKCADLGEQAGRSISPDTGVGSFVAPPEITDKEQNRGLPPVDPVEELAGNTAQPKGLIIAITPAVPSGLSPSAEDNPSAPAMISRRVSLQVNEASRRSKPDDIQGSVCVLNPEMRVRGRRNLEAKTAKRASYIISVFSLCWLPLFVMSYIDSRTEVDILATCIATMSAALNPIVYTVVNKSFRKEFVKIFRRLTRCCPSRCTWLHKP